MHKGRLLCLQSSKEEDEGEEPMEVETGQEKDDSKDKRDPPKRWFFNKIFKQLPTELQQFMQSKELAWQDKTCLVNVHKDSKGKWCLNSTKTFRFSSP